MALLEAVVLERAPLERSGAGEHRGADHPAVGDEPGVARSGEAEHLVGAVREKPEGKPHCEKADDDERHESPGVRSITGDPAEHGDQRKRGGQHHRRDHQYPG